MNELKPEDVMRELEYHAEEWSVLKDALALLREKDAEIERLRAELAEAEAEAEKAIDIAEGNIRAEIASGGTSCHWCEDKVRADTVRKMHSEIKERCIKGGIYPAFVASTIDQITKEMLEGNE